MKFLLAVAAVLATVSTPALAEQWHPYSRTATRVYMADVASIAGVDGTLTAIRTANVPLSGPADDLTHSEEMYQFDCAAGTWRTAGAKDFAADGSADGDYPEEGAAWEPVRPNTMPEFISLMACDGSRTSGAHYPSIQAYIEAGRP